MAETHAILEDDTAAARRELASSQYGEYPNAEELIRAHAARQSPEVGNALRRQVNELASNTLDLSTIEVPEGGLLLDAVVRGSYVSFVYETEDGHVLHGAVAYDPGEHAAEDETAAAQVKAGVQAAAEDAHLGAQAEAEAAAAGGSTGGGEWPSTLPSSHAKLDALAAEHGIEFDDDASVADKQEVLEAAKAEDESG
jgi:hypothetical protein